MSKPFVIITDPVTYHLNDMIAAFWLNSGKEKYEASKVARYANGIPDSQWFKAQLFDIIDNAKIEYINEPDPNK